MRQYPRRNPLPKVKILTYATHHPEETSCVSPGAVEEGEPTTEEIQTLVGWELQDPTRDPIEQRSCFRYGRRMYTPSEFRDPA